MSHCQMHRHCHSFLISSRGIFYHGFVCCFGFVHIHNKLNNILRDVYINQQDAQIFLLNGSTCFGLSLVHHQEQHLISCTVQLIHAGMFGCSQMYWHVSVGLYSLLNVAPDDGLMIVRNM